MDFSSPCLLPLIGKKLDVQTRITSSNSRGDLITIFHHVAVLAMILYDFMLFLNQTVILSGQEAILVGHRFTPTDKQCLVVFSSVKIVCDRICIRSHGLFDGDCSKLMKVA